MKSLMPKRLFTRLMVIVMVPMVVVQVVTILVFYERHWDTVTRYMATNLSADVAVIVDQYAANQTPEQFEDTAFMAGDIFILTCNGSKAQSLKKKPICNPAIMLAMRCNKAMRKNYPIPTGLI